MIFCIPCMTIGMIFLYRTGKLKEMESWVYIWGSDDEIIGSCNCR